MDFSDMKTVCQNENSPLSFVVQAFFNSLTHYKAFIFEIPLSSKWDLVVRNVHVSLKKGSNNTKYNKSWN